MASEQQRSTRWRNMVALSWMGLAPTYVIYTAATYTGLYQLLAELDLRIFGSYDPTGTFIGLVIGLCLPVRFIAPDEWKRPRPELLGIGVDPQAARRTTKQTLLAIGAVSLLTGIVATGVALSEGSGSVSTEVDLSQSTAVPSARRLTVTGTLQTQYAYIEEETLNGSVTQTRFVPLTGPAWNPTQPVQYILRQTLAREVSDEDVPLPGHTGNVKIGPAAVFHHTLPGMVRTGYERNGLRLVPDVIVLDENLRGANDTAWVVAVFGYLFAFVTVILWAATKRSQQASATLPGIPAAYTGAALGTTNVGPPRRWQLRLGGELMADLSFVEYETPSIHVSVKASPGITPFWRYFTDPQTWPDHDAAFDAMVQLVKQRGGFVLIPEGGASTQSFSLVNFDHTGGDLRV